MQTVCELLHFELFNIKDSDVCVLTLKTADGSLGNFHKIGGIFFKKLFAYIFHVDKKVFQINVNIYNLSNSFINAEYCSSVVPPRGMSSFNTGNSLFFIISLPLFVNSPHKAPNIVCNPFNDVGKNGIP